ncbi:hypothetical protein LUZ60_015374 [Juncus effusus]|nr:hypothetical protein LUZ60_015374 [Juncus effusus]
MDFCFDQLGYLHWFRDLDLGLGFLHCLVLSHDLGSALDFHFGFLHYEQMSHDLGSADVVLRGYAGWKSRQGLQILPKIFPIDAIIQPSLVIVYFGGNDSIEPQKLGLSPHVPLNEYIDNMRKIGLHITSLSETTRVIFLSCPPIRSSPYDREKNRANETRRIYSDACIKMCNEMNFKVVDMFNAIQMHEDWANVCFTDGLHFSAEASEIVAKSILNAIYEANWEPSLHYEDLPVEFQDVTF